jgi:hypothetical protein
MFNAHICRTRIHNLTLRNYLLKRLHASEFFKTEHVTLYMLAIFRHKLTMWRKTSYRVCHIPWYMKNFTYLHQVEIKMSQVWGKECPSIPTSMINTMISMKPLQSVICQPNCGVLSLYFSQTFSLAWKEKFLPKGGSSFCRKCSSNLLLNITKYNKQSNYLVADNTLPQNDVGRWLQRIGKDCWETIHGYCGTDITSTGTPYKTKYIL